MKADTQTEAAVLDVLDKFAENYSNRNLEGVLALFAQDPDLVLYGTGADEKRIGPSELREQVERDWSQSDAVSFTREWTIVSSAGSVAWVAADISFSAKIGGQELSFHGRLTSVLENRGGSWLIVQSHFSSPVAAQEEGESFPT